MAHFPTIFLFSIGRLLLRWSCNFRALNLLPFSRSSLMTAPHSTPENSDIQILPEGGVSQQCCIFRFVLQWSVDIIKTGFIVRDDAVSLSHRIAWRITRGEVWLMDDVPESVIVVETLQFHEDIYHEPTMTGYHSQRMPDFIHEQYKVTS